MIKYIFGLCFVMGIGIIQAQGPPITADKPIMLGSKSVIVKTLTEIHNTDAGHFVKAPLMVHYLPTANSLVAVHLPWTHFGFDNQSENNGTYLGDIGILGKFQFLRKDMTAKTFRMVLKTYQTLPTGQEFGPIDVSAGKYQSYLGLVAGYETIKHGISGELGYNLVPDGDFDEWRFNLGFGLPILKPLYPVNQINFYFEYSQRYRPHIDEFEVLFAQGVQYARGRLTMEVALQLPLYQDFENSFALNSKILLGTRYIF